MVPCPADTAIAQRYDAERLAGKMVCRSALQAELGLALDEKSLLLTIVSRLTAQKGLDLLLAALPVLVRAGVQLAVQGTGEPALEAAFRMAQQAHPDACMCTLVMTKPVRTGWWPGPM